MKTDKVLMRSLASGFKETLTKQALEALPARLKENEGSPWIAAALRQERQQVARGGPWGWFPVGELVLVVGRSEAEVSEKVTALQESAAADGGRVLYEWCRREGEWHGRGLVMA